MSVIELKSRAEFNKLLEENPYVAIQAHASWCGPCKAISPFFAKHADALTKPNGYAFAKFDTDDVPDLAHELGIRSIPAFFFFEKGDKVDSLAGANPPALKKTVEIYSEKLAASSDEPKEGEALKTDADF